MKQDIQKIPPAYHLIHDVTLSSGFTMASDFLTGSLLQALAAAKPGGNFLELGTGTGLSTSWILEGMTQDARLISIDNDERFLSIARTHLGSDERLTLELADGEDWINRNATATFDYIFADTWHGKYLMQAEVLMMLRPGGLYIVDDMLPQANWPDGHAEKAEALVAYLESRSDLLLTKMHWATGIIVAVKR
jgi:predicted O-methyltransferase YrrM